MLYSKINTFDSILPYPATWNAGEGLFSLDQGIKILSSPEFTDSGKRLLKIADFLQIPVKDNGKTILLQQTRSVEPGNWKITVTTGNVILESNDYAGMMYAVSALSQMLSIATMSGPGRFAGLNCGSAEDHPRFNWRGFMLDSARHFCSPEQVKELLHLLAYYRFNVFHWHLTDNEGWRTPSEIYPELSRCYELEEGFYSKQDLKEICELAANLNIRIVPEIDWPGHSRLLTENIPDFRCKNCDPGDELCIGSDDVREKAAALLAEFMDLFPDSTEIHLGGDEADPAHWENCPLCQNALKTKNLPDVRALEHDFMLGLVDQVRAAGKTPIVWCDSGVYPKDVIVQLWCSKGRMAALENGNPVIDSNCAFFYCNRLLDNAEPQYADNQPVSIIEDTYGYEPLGGYPQFANQLLGVEGCVWTGYLPERLMMSKVMPRLPAFSEIMWGKPQHKCWSGFYGRWLRLRSAGLEYIW